MYRLIAQLCASAGLEQVADAITVVSQDIWRALAPAQLAWVLSRVLAVVLVLRAVVSLAGLLLVVDLLVDHAPLLATSAVAPTTLLVTARLRQ